MEMMKLKNGTEEAKPVVAITQMSIREVWQDNPLAIYDLHSKCQDPDYEFFGDNGEILKRLNLVQSDGRIHQSIKNVVLSMVEGEGMDMTLVSPVAQ